MEEEIGGLWLFGYGSLIWKPPPHYTKSIPGYVEGYVRRFWQASEDHRGTPASPGRVVTLITRSFWETLTDSHPTTPSHTLGVAYYIPAHHVPTVKAYLDIREINGYSIHHTTVYPLSPRPEYSSLSSTPPPIENCMVYIGTPTNPQFVGPQEPQALAEWIYRSRGPSGENKEYLLMLDEALRALGGEDDEHVGDLADRDVELETARDVVTDEEDVGLTNWC